MAIKPASSRYRVITPLDNGDTLDLGPAGTESFVGTYVFQFNPDVQWNGSIAVLARLTGAAAQSANLPFLPVPYRRVTVNNVASDYTFVFDQISGATKIQVPSNMDAIGFLVSCTAGTMSYVGWDLHGPSGP